MHYNNKEIKDQMLLYLLFYVMCIWRGAHGHITLIKQFLPCVQNFNHRKRKKNTQRDFFSPRGVSCQFNTEEPFELNYKWIIQNTLSHFYSLIAKRTNPEYFSCC